jgi:hypothetical protein
MECIRRGMPRALFVSMTTNTTIGELVASLYEEYEAQYHDTRIAALATHDAIAELRGVRRRTDLKTYASVCKDC